MDYRQQENRYLPEADSKDPRCAVGIVDFDIETGLVEHVGMRGHATLKTFAERANTLLRHYLGHNESTWDTRFRAALIDTDSVLVKFEPQTVVVRDVSYVKGLDFLKYS